MFDASAVVSAALKENSVPELALLQAEAVDLFALSSVVEAELVDVFSRPRFTQMISDARRARILDVIVGQAAWFDPTDRVTDCRDAKDNKYLELALASGADTIVSGDNDLLILHPWRGVRILRPAEYLAASGAIEPRVDEGKIFDSTPPSKTQLRTRPMFPVCPWVPSACPRRAIMRSHIGFHA